MSPLVWVFSSLWALSLEQSVYCPYTKLERREKPVYKCCQNIAVWNNYCDWRGGCYKPQREYYYSKEIYNELVEVNACCAGYREVKNDKLTCEPICSISCKGGTCIEPNTCHCPHGYVLINKTSCEPFCKNHCFNGICTKPDTCACLPNYSFVNGSSNECEPVCSQDCKNGFCSAPEFCQCFKGYVKRNGSEYICDPVCSKQCINSTCAAADVCTCLVGYEQLDQWTCRPACSHGCNGKGTCVNPGVCHCQIGYKGDDCTPECPDGCEGGECINPGKCQCSEKYVYLNGTCEPICQNGCINGTCVLPDVCECFDGFTNTSLTECSPECVDGCTNGDCVAPDTCYCHSGFLHHPSDSSLCLPPLGAPQPLTAVFLNKYKFSQVVLINEEEETFSVTNFPMIKLTKSCSSLLGIMNKSMELTECNQFQLTCNHEESFSNSTIQLVCQWNLNPNEINGTSTSSSLNSTLTLNGASSLPNSTLLNTTGYNTTGYNTTNIRRADLSILLLFPHMLSEAEHGSCDLCLCESIATRQFSFGDEFELIMHPCPPDASFFLTEDNNTVVWPFVVSMSIVLVSVLGWIIYKFFLKKYIQREAFVPNEETYTSKLVEYN